MGFLDINAQSGVDPESIKSDGPPAERKGAWWEHLQATVNKFLSGEVEEGKFLELARFTSAAGARVKAKQLEKRQAPGAGTFEFKTQTWIGETDQKRHSSLYATYKPAEGEVAAYQAKVQADTPDA